MVVVGVAAAQDRQPFRPLDQGIEDATELGASLRQVPMGLREPMNFDRVYSIAGTDDLLMRAHGGLYAVFPESTYQRGSSNAMVPTGTVFYIGRSSLKQIGLPDIDPVTGEIAEKPEGLRGDEVDARVDARVDGRVREGVTMPTQGLLIDAQRASRSMVSRVVPAMKMQVVGDVDEATAANAPILHDANYRVERVAELLARAASAERGE